MKLNPLRLILPLCLVATAHVLPAIAATMVPQAYLKASNTRAGDWFGSSVAMSGDTAVVGARFEHSNATGANGNQGDNSAPDSGAAYVYVRNGSRWIQQAYLKASNAGASDEFGSVVVSGDTVVVGASGEASSATGVNGNRSDNSAGDSGAAYVFRGFGHGPSLALASDGSGGYFLRGNAIPYVRYSMQRSPSAAGPWSSVVTNNTAPASGLLEFHDTNAPPGQAFYRTAQP